MKSRRIEIWVGLFVVLTIAALLLLALQVSGLSNLYSAKGSYIVKAGFTNIGSLKPRAKITICGVTIGRVIGITLQEEDSEYEAMVELAIQNEFNKIPDDSAAKILTAGLLGDNYVEIVPGQSETVLKQDSKIQMTSQAILLEDLISKIATSGGGK